MRRGTDLETLLKEIQEKDEIISHLKQGLDQVLKENEKLNAQNIQLMLTRTVSIERPQQGSGQQGQVGMQRYEGKMEEYRQLKEQQRKRQVESYEYRINELISSVGRHRDLAKMWEVRCQEQQNVVKQAKKGSHELIVIIGLKKRLISSICQELGEFFQEQVTQSQVLDKIKVLIQGAKTFQSDGSVYADVLTSLRNSNIAFFN